jgi:hypothetical protein
MWVVPVPGGLHRCIQCQLVVGKKDVFPKFEDLTPEFQQRWTDHERSAEPTGSAERAG